jgi:hypothetical protein
MGGRGYHASVDGVGIDAGLVARRGSSVTSPVASWRENLDSRARQRPKENWMSCDLGLAESTWRSKLGPVCGLELGQGEKQTAEMRNYVGDVVRFTK